MAKTDVTTYFRRTSLFWIIAITLAVGHFTWIVFSPDSFPYHYLGPYGTFCKYLADNHAGFLYKLWWAAFAIHVLEAAYSLKACSDKGITSSTTRLLWFVQTFLFGFASLGLLLKSNPMSRPKQN